MRIGITGDTHGDPFLSQIFSAKRKGLTHLIVCGDFGYVWMGSKYENDILDYINNIGIQVLFIDGNHDNHILLRQYPIQNKFGGKVRVIRDNIIYLLRGEVYTINDKKFLTIGGARSIDRDFRIKNVSWWEEEILNEKERSNTLYNLHLNNYKIDYIITHTIFNEVINELVQNPTLDEVSIFLDEIKSIVTFDCWYFGHLHEDLELSKYNARALFKDIYEL